MIAVHARELEYHGLTRSGSSSGPASPLKAGPNTSSPHLPIAAQVLDTAEKLANRAKAVVLRGNSVQPSRTNLTANLHAEK